jgi:hypothetical protein
MAKITFGPIVSEARGKQGNVVFSRDRSGAISRQVPHWTQPNTLSQKQARAWLRNAGKSWYQILTPAQRQSWENLAANQYHADRFNQVHNPDGQQLYSQCNLDLAAAGGSPLYDAPAKLSAPDPGPLTCSASADAGTLTINPTLPIPANHAPILRATKGLSPGINFFAKWLRQIGNQPPNFVPLALPDSGPAYLDKFRTMTGGLRIGVTLAYVNLLTGARSPAQSALITTGPGITMLITTIEISSAQLLALKEIPVPVIPPPGVGKTIFLIGLNIDLHFATTPYALPTDANPPNLYMGPQPTSGQISSAGVATAIPGLWTETQNAQLQTPNGTPLSDITPWDNQPIALSLASDASGDLTAGDSSITLTVLYAIVPTT